MMLCEAASRPGERVSLALRRSFVDGSSNPAAGLGLINDPGGFAAVTCPAQFLSSSANVAVDFMFVICIFNEMTL